MKGTVQYNNMVMPSHHWDKITNLAYLLGICFLFHKFNIRENSLFANDFQACSYQKPGWEIA